MPRAGVDKQHLFTFVAGLISEASGLTYPENSLKSGDNLDVNRKGEARRRLGVDYELNYQLSSDTYDSSVVEFEGISYHDWPSVNNDGSINFFVIQVGDILYIYNKSADPLSSGFLTSVDIGNYQIVVQGSGKVGFSPTISLDSAVLKGKLFLVGPITRPIVLEYDLVAEELRVTLLTLRVRDFDGVDDGLSVDERPATLSVQKEYNLMNQGWIDTADSGVNDGVNTSQTGPSTSTNTDWELVETITGILP